MLLVACYTLAKQVAYASVSRETFFLASFCVILITAMVRFTLYLASQMTHFRFAIFLQQTDGYPTMATPHYATPHGFFALIQPLTPWLAAMACLLVAVGSYLALWHSPMDYQQGEYVRMMYVHVPAAWLSMALYATLGIASFSYVVWKNPMLDVACRAISPIGAGCTGLCLLTGMLWGKPMWGAWWVWDARLTSMLLLWFLYVGHMAVLRSLEPASRASHSAALLAIIGLINLPIIKYSVEWWNSLHQGASVFKAGGSSIHTSMLQPLLLMFLAMALTAGLLIILDMQNSLLEAKLRTRKIRQRKLDTSPLPVSGHVGA